MTREVMASTQSGSPQSIYSRGALFVLSACALALGVLLLSLIVRANGLTWGEWLFRLAMLEGFVVLFLAGCVGVLWAATAPRWLPAMARRVAGFVTECLLIPWPILVGLMLWP